MLCHRLFIVGVIVLFIGIQFRMVESFTLNEKGSKFVETRLKTKKKDVAPSYMDSLALYDETWLGDLNSGLQPKLTSILPPRWLGWSLISVGAVLVLTFPCFRS